MAFVTRIFDSFTALNHVAGGGRDRRAYGGRDSAVGVLKEVAVDYNAAMVGTLAGLYAYYGQNQPMTSFTPPPEPVTDSYYTTATMNQDSD